MLFFFPVSSALSKHKAILRSQARFSALLPAQWRWSSSWKQTSNTQWREFSMRLAQYPPRNKLCEAPAPSNGRQDGASESSTTWSRHL